MSDVILYKKQKDQLAKATGKAIEALNDLAVVLNTLGVSPIGTPVKATEAATATEAAPAKKTKGAKEKKAKAGKQPVARNGGSAFAEM